MVLIAEIGAVAAVGIAGYNLGKDACVLVDKAIHVPENLQRNKEQIELDMRIVDRAENDAREKAKNFGPQTVIYHKEWERKVEKGREKVQRHIAKCENPNNGWFKQAKLVREGSGIKKDINRLQIEGDIYNQTRYNDGTKKKNQVHSTITSTNDYESINSKSITPENYSSPSTAEYSRSSSSSNRSASIGHYGSPETNHSRSRSKLSREGYSSRRESSSSYDNNSRPYYSSNSSMMGGGSSTPSSGYSSIEQLGHYIFANPHDYHSKPSPFSDQW